MSSLILPRRFSYRPQDNVEVARGNSLTDGLRFAALLNNANTDSVSNNEPIYKTGTSKSVSSDGVVTSFGSGFLSFNDSSLLDLPLKHSVFCKVKFNAIGVSSALVFKGVQGLEYASYSLVLGACDSNGTSDRINYAVRLSNSFANTKVTSTAAPDIGVDIRLAAVSTGSQLRLYINGILDATTASTVLPYNGITPLRLGSDATTINSGIRYSLDGSLSDVFIFGRELSDDEVRLVSFEPWQLFKAKPRVLYFTTAGGGTNTAAAAGSGSIAVTGSAATALRTFLAAASSASVSVTGSAAIGVAARKSAADAGSIALTGSAATALRTHLAAASSGSIALSGSAANAVRTFLTAAESGAVTVTGSAANGIYTPVGAYNADAQSGAISITGSAASGVYTPVGATNSNAQSGAISVTGSAAIGRHDYLAAAGSGSITVTGSAANAVKSLGAVADSGSIAITGSNALAIRTWLASADAGSITLTGSSANGVKATIGTGTLDPATIAAIADAVWAHSSAVDYEQLALAILAAAQITPIHTDVRRMNNAPVIGTGSNADKWRGE